MTDIPPMVPSAEERATSVLQEFAFNRYTEGDLHGEKPPQELCMDCSASLGSWFGHGSNSIRG